MCVSLVPSPDTPSVQQPTMLKARFGFVPGGVVCMSALHRRKVSCKILVSFLINIYSYILGNPNGGIDPSFLKSVCSVNHVSHEA